MFMKDKMLELNAEKQLFDKDYKVICAVDEAGRGPLAGPVVAACVSITPDFKVDKDAMKFIRDSKKLSEKRREEMFDLVHEVFPEVRVGICNHKIIDEVNILQATFLAMKKAIEDLENEAEFAIVDGKMKIPNLRIKQQAIVSGDSLVLSVAAASIIAKVTRDRLMKEIHEKYPEYGFDKHKGYGTKVHMEALKKHGPCEIHRTSFAPVKRVMK